MAIKQPGTITLPVGLIVEPHEQRTAHTLAAAGYNITFLMPTRTKGTTTPDIQMDGLLWEIKSPTGKSHRTIANQFDRATKQCENIIIDIRRCPIAPETIRKQIDQILRHKPRIKRVKLVTKQGKIVDIKP